MDEYADDGFENDDERNHSKLLGRRSQAELLIEEEILSDEGNDRKIDIKNQAKQSEVFQEEYLDDTYKKSSMVSANVALGDEDEDEEEEYIQSEQRRETMKRGSQALQRKLVPASGQGGVQGKSSQKKPPANQENKRVSNQSHQSRPSQGVVAKKKEETVSPLPKIIKTEQSPQHSVKPNYKTSPTNNKDPSPKPIKRDLKVSSGAHSQLQQQAYQTQTSFPPRAPAGNASLGRPQTQNKGGRVTITQNKQMFRIGTTQGPINLIGQNKEVIRASNNSKTASGRAVSSNQQQRGINSQGAPQNISASQQNALQFQIPVIYQSGAQTQNNFYSQQQQQPPQTFDPIIAQSLAYVSASQLNVPRRNQQEKFAYPQMLNTYQGLPPPQPVLLKRQPQQQHSADKADSSSRGGRRKVIANIIKMQGSSAQDIASSYQMQSIMHGQSSNSVQNQGSIIIERRDSAFFTAAQLKRKKIKDILGLNSLKPLIPLHSHLMSTEKEELQNQTRAIKVQFNVLRDENMRLKTKLAFMQQEIDRRDKDIEILSVKIHQNGIQAIAKDNVQLDISQTTASLAGVNQGASLFESYLVTSLKKQNRELKDELKEKQDQVEKLKRNTKLTRGIEVEHEIQSYIEECQRMRSMLETTVMQNKQLHIIATAYTHQLLQMGVTPSIGNGNPHTQSFIVNNPMRTEPLPLDSQVQPVQTVMTGDGPIMIDDREAVLQDEITMRFQLQQNLLSERHKRERFQKKLALAELRLKKFTHIMNTNERQRKIIIDKGNELNRLRDEIEEIRDKARERDQVNNTNKNLVTKYYGQTTAMSEKDKRIQELKDSNQRLQDQLREVSRNPNSTIRNTPSLSKGSPRRSDLPSSVKRVAQKSSGLALALNNQSTTSVSSQAQQLTPGPFQPSYVPYLAELIYRTLKKQAVTNTGDNAQFKTYASSHADEIKREVDYIQKRLIGSGDHLRNQVAQRLSKKLDNLSAYQQAVFRSVNELEKFIDTVMQITEKDLKKLVLWTMIILPHAKSLHEIPLGPFLEVLRAKISGQLSQAVLPPVLEVEDTQLRESVLEHQQSPHEKRQSLKKSPFRGSPKIQSQKTSPKGHEDGSQNKRDRPSNSPFKARSIKDSVVTQKDYLEETLDRQSQKMQSPTSPQNLQQSKRSNQSQKTSPFKPRVPSKHEEEQEDDYEEDLRQDEEDELLQQERLGSAGMDDSKAQEDSYPNSIQITEDQMLDIAENVFQVIADRLRQLNISLRRAFHKRLNIVDDFEGETNVIVIQAANFLDAVKSPPLSLPELSELEVACLMRVLSKPELDHAILLQELGLVLENFGIPMQEVEAEDIREEAEKKKNKQNKKKQIRSFLEAKQVKPESQQLFTLMRAFVSACEESVEHAMSLISQHKYEQLVKSKKKEVKTELIRKDDFLALIKARMGVDLSEPEHCELVDILVHLLQLDPKYYDVLQVKNIQFLLEEVWNTHMQDEQDKKVIQEFYKPSTAEIGTRKVSKMENQIQQAQEEAKSPDDLLDGTERTQAAKVEVLNFEEIMSPPHEAADEDTNQTYEEDGQGQGRFLNEIAEVDAANEENYSPVNPQRRRSKLVPESSEHTD